MSNKIAIYGAYGEANIGDDLLLDTILSWLSERSPNSVIYISSNEKSYLHKLYPKYKIIPKIRIKYMRPDLFILGGGTQLFTFKSNITIKKTNKFNTAIRLVFRYPTLIFGIIKFKMNLSNLTTRKIALGIGLGPFEEENSQAIVKRELTGFNMLYLRDEFSFQLCQEFNLPSKLTSDICFSNYFRDKFPFKHIKDDNKLNKVGIVLRDWTQNENGKIINTKMLNWIDSNIKKFDITVFLFSTIKDNDLKKKFALNSKVKSIIWNPENDNFQSFLNNFSKMDAIVTSRFHAGVFGANFNIPTICLGIDPKLYLLTQEIKGFYYFDIFQDIKEINNYLEEIFSNYSSITTNIETSYKSLNKRANEQFNHAEMFLKKNII
jgi:polysaccharide pyruvyl transferase WcaK-like protein